MRWQRWCTVFMPGQASIGGVVSFIGLMRDMNQGDAVSTMRLEHYPA